MNDTAVPIEPQEGAWLSALLAGLAVSVWLAVIASAWRRKRAGLPLVEPLPSAIPPWGGGEVALVMLLHMACLLAASAIAAPEATNAPQRTRHGSATGAVRILAAAGGMTAATLLSSGFLMAGGAAFPMLGFGSRRPLEDLRLAVVTLAAITPPLLVMAGLLDRLVPYRHPVVDLLAGGHDVETLVAVVLSAVLVAPIAEEFFFRRVLQGWFEGLEARARQWVGRRPSGWPPVAASSLVFALAHLEHGLGWIPLVFFGLAVGWLARQRGSLVPGIIVHALFNAVSVGLLVLSGGPGRS